jgi:predicted HTH transcriptional regulator
MKLNKQQHEAFAKFFETPTRESLRDVLKHNIGETDYLDFKREWPEPPKLAKHILALANSGGGALVVGVEQLEGGEIESVGLPVLTDKVDIYKAVKAYLPSETEVDLFEFAYTESEYPTIKGKKFQVLLVESNPRHLPLLATKSGDGIRDNAIYVRRGTSSEEATHSDVQAIISKRIETGFSGAKALKLNQHIEQLQVIDKARKGNNTGLFGARGMLAEYARIMGERSTTEDYDKFIEDLYKRKKRLLEKELGL